MRGTRGRRAAWRGAGAWRLVAAAMLVAGPLHAVSAHAGANRCTYNGREFEQGAMICQAGLEQLCMNGEWQNQGRFCSGVPDGAMLGYPFQGPGQVDLGTRREIAPPPDE